MVENLLKQAATVQFEKVEKIVGEAGKMMLEND